MSQLPLALTMGDPAGIGPDITIDCWLNRSTRPCPVFFWIGYPEILEERAKILGVECKVVEISSPDEAAKVFETGIPCLSLAQSINPDALNVQVGEPSSKSAIATIESIVRGVEIVFQNEAAAVVTNPISKEVLYGAGFQFPGHTEFLAHLAGEMFGETPHPVMMIYSDELAVVPATIHIALKDAPRVLTSKLIYETGEVIYQDMRKYFGLDDPRIAVAGLNPHAGEGGAMGNEEAEIIQPAIDYLLHKGIDVSGPHPADTLFHAEARKGYDVVLGMYHDQVLAPVKTLAFDEGVNITLGLPFIRTSPDHGTAFNIAGKGKARSTSLLSALRQAEKMAQASVHASDKISS